MATQPPSPIAIIGMGCRFPGGANSPEKLWEMLAEGRSGWSEVPPDRWNSNSFHHPSLEAKDGFNAHGGNFLDQDTASFEPTFFGIPSNEAECMDPQQRILLETTYEALENAGIPQENVRGTDTGVYVAYFSRDYDRMVFKDTSDIPKFHLTGAGVAIVSNRLSYLFNLTGPSMTVDTGCSGSMVALHLACQSLRSGESKMSLVGGVNLHLAPDFSVAMSFSGILNKDGKCYTFDNRGVGYGRGEGCATMVLKRLDDALAAGDPIRAVIRNTAVNQDGKTNGISLPNEHAQKDLFRSIYLSVGLDPTETGYIEAHGTGTMVGDKAEIESIAEVFCENGNRKDSVYVGSVKSNIGHLEAASGLAGVIKTVMVLEKGLIPSNLNLEVVKEGLQLEERKIKVPLTLTAWQKDGIRRASVNSFGYGGTNAHAILEAAPDVSRLIPKSNFVEPNKALVNKNTTNQPDDFCVDFSNGFPAEHCSRKLQNGGSNGNHVYDRAMDQLHKHEDIESGISNGTAERDGKSEEMKPEIPRLFVLTAKSQKSFPMIQENLRHAVMLHEGDETYLKHLEYTLTCRRSVLSWRGFVVASTPQELINALDPVSFRAVKAATDIRLQFIFTGQGSQWYAMGRELITSNLVFRDSLSKSAGVLKDLGAGWDLVHELLLDKNFSRVNQSEISQPVTTAIQIGLVDMLDTLGIKPKSVLGHSSGEIAAAYAAGILSRESALTVSFRRGFVASFYKNVSHVQGAMLAVGVGENEIIPYMDRVRMGILCVACVNSPSSTTISGDAIAIDELIVLLNEVSVFNRKLKVDVAYHSHHMKEVSARYLHSIEGLVAENPLPGVKFYSSVYGREKSSGFGAHYWVDNLVSQVKFSEALEKLCRSQQKSSQSSTIHAFIEVGPHSALQGPVRQTITQLNLNSFKHHYLPTLVRDKTATRTNLNLSGKLFELGYPVKLAFSNFQDDPNLPKVVVTDLAPYYWDHSVKYWRESRLSRQHRLRSHPYHDLLGLRIVSSSINQPTWRHIFGIDSLPWLQDHVVDDFVIFPGAGYLCMAIEAVRQITSDRKVPGTITNYVLRDVSFSKALIIPESPGTVELLLTLCPTTKVVADQNANMWEDFRISSISADGSWSEHCSGSIITEFPVSGADEVEGSRESQFSAIRQQEELNNIKRHSTHQMDVQAMYEDFKMNGNVYGPSFAAIKQLSFGDCQGFGSIEIPDVASFMPSNFFQPHVIHPTTLDALMQLELPLFNRHCGAGAVMPTFLEKLTVSASISNSSGANLIVSSNIFPAGSYSASFDFTAFQMVDGVQTTVCSLSQGELRRIGESPVNASSQLYSRKMSYNIEWNLDVDFLMPRAIEPHNTLTTVNYLTPHQRMEIFEQAASLYIIEALGKVGANQKDIAENHHIELLKWMKTYAASEDCQRLVKGMRSSHRDTSLSALKQFGAEGEMLSRIGSNLEAILLGKLEPLSIMLEDDLLSRFYKEHQAVQQCHLRMAEYLKLMSFQDSFMSVLEIGAGAGSATIHVLEAFRHEQGLRLKNYDFTDISSGFFEKAKPTLEGYSDRINYKTLDIEIDPIKQGFNAGSYDLVIASNVLHATSCIDDTLANVRKLLRPGGRLILVELTRLTANINTIFGVLPGWWAGVGDGRKDCPLLTTNQWNDALSKNGFNGVEIAVSDYNGPAQSASLVISKAVLQRVNAVLAPVEVVCESNSKIMQAFAVELVTAFINSGFQASIRPWPTLIRKSVIYIVIDDSQSLILADLSPARFHQVTALMTLGESVIWITAQDDISSATKPERGMVNGLARVARAENEGMHFLLVDVQQSVDKDCDNIVSAVSKLLTGAFGPGAEREKSKETEFRIRNGQLYISRLVPDAKFDAWIKHGKAHQGIDLFHDPKRSLKLHVEVPGLLDSLIFIEDNLVETPLPPNEIEIETLAHGVNFKDVFIALGQMKATERMAGECAGIVRGVGSDLTSRYRIGDRVCGWGSVVPFASRSRVLGNCAHQLPDLMSFATAASVPIVFLTAYHCLLKIANLKKGQTVLIHAASGGVGQAAMMLAKHIGAEIIATVGSTAKAQLLREYFDIPNSHIFSSRLRSFKKGIMRLTNGKGVDVVLNSLSGEALRDTWECIAHSGTFVEIGKTDIFKRNELSMVPFDRMVTFASFDLLIMRQHRSAEAGAELAEIMSLFDQGVLKPVNPITEYQISNIEEAFRIIQARKHIGKVVLISNREDSVKVMCTRPSLKLEGNGTFVVTGGLGDLGRRICHFLAKHGVKNIVTLSRRKLDPEVRKELEDEVRALGAELHIMACDITDRRRVQEIASLCLDTLPPIEGVIQAAMVLRDGFLEKMEYDDFMTAVNPKYYGTKYLDEAFRGPSLKSFIMLSSVASVLGNRGQGNYAVGCSYQDELAKTSSFSTHYMSLNLGLIEGSDIDVMFPERREYMLGQGAIPVTMDELFALLEYSLGPQAREDRCWQHINGFDRVSLSKNSDHLSKKVPMLSHLPYVINNTESATSGATTVNIEETLAATTNLDEAESVICGLIVLKLSALVALDADDVSLDVPVADFGLDSLVAIELKNWIVRKLLASMQTSEILDMPSIRALAAKVALRSALVGKSLGNPCTEEDVQDLEPFNELEPSIEGHGLLCCQASKEIHKLPLLSLDKLMESYLQGIHHLVTEEEYITAVKTTEDFQMPGGLGQQLYGQLVKRNSDPDVDNWMADLYLNSMYLSRRWPVAPFTNMMGCLPSFPIPHSQAERAAVIALAAFKFKHGLETAEITPDHLHDTPLCMDAQYWLFNATRIPRINLDEVTKYDGPEYDYLVVMRRGHIFKVPLTEKNETVPHEKLRSTFQKILNMGLEESWISLLTADERDSWAILREKIRTLNPENETTIRVIDGACFVVCLDDGSPATPQERINHFMLGTGFNRWHDKSFQFLICENSATAFMGEHAKMDGASVFQLHDFVRKAIRVHRPDPSLYSDSTLPFREYPLQTTLDIGLEITRMRADWLERVADVDYGHLVYSGFGADYLKFRRCNPQSGYEIVLQLAARMIFGYNRASWQAVNMSHYHKGRTEIIQTMTATMAEFCGLAIKENPPIQICRRLFFDAAREHASATMRAQKGLGYDRTITAMEYLAKQQGYSGETMPSLYTDTAWLKTRPQEIMTGATDGSMAETASVWRRDKSLWVHYEVTGDGARFSVVGHHGRGQEYCRLVEKAADIVKSILDE